MWCGLHGLDADLPWIVRGQTGAAASARDHTPHRHCFGSSHPDHPLRRLGGENMGTIFEKYKIYLMLVLYGVGLIYMHV